MMFKLSNDLVFFDVETTGLHVLRDRILQIAMIKYFQNGDQPVELNIIINPGIPISEEAYKIHGIGPKEVENKPFFKDIAQELFDFIGDSDLAGYNSNRFDIPILAEEFDRCGFNLDLDKRRQIDIQRIFYKMEPRTLKAAYQFYCNEELVDAHDALADIKATVKVLEGQLKKYEGVDYINEEGQLINSPVINDMQVLHEFTNDLKTIDATQRLRYNEQGNIVFNFGKYMNQTFEQVWQREPNYFHWILDKEFSFQVKNTVKNYLKQQEEIKLKLK
ncbi:MAG: ribonuclease H-like domain-containing protein [Saprospiraceae bacterium]|nr:ribonuclease H-like domain-containing protein [Saprospiraceae bacterium]MBK9722217.1 ribonuclease H-like domain-containing protein [Saprospiraceae bacterium]MBK9729238.1 ribonuclease H-like domain-containing protein [Saprospiraceae bacterium]